MSLDVAVSRYLQSLFEPLSDGSRSVTFTKMQCGIQNGRKKHLLRAFMAMIYR